MTETIHVNGTSNSLVHKGSTGFAKCTIPDVCKTPSPGGPVPIPYPIIVSMSSDLKKGTKTVKVDGKKMAAIKGSEFSRCSGDEPGTAGGVKSSTNMKEATWILYSFDVKLDGKNACRLSDKMMMNHGNTACLAGWVQPPVAGGAGVVELNCHPDPKWDDCQRKQMCAKAKALDAFAKARGPLMFGKLYGPYRRSSGWFQRNFRQRFAGSKDPKKYLDDCARTNGKPMHVDHVLEKQLGGHPAGPLRFLDASVNMSSGSQLNHFNKRNPGAKISGVQGASNCNCS